MKEIPKETNPYPPTVLNTVISNIDYSNLDINIMLTQIYPKNPPIIKGDKNYILPSPTSVIYFFVLIL